MSRLGWALQAGRLALQALKRGQADEAVRLLAYVNELSPDLDPGELEVLRGAVDWWMATGSR